MRRNDYQQDVKDKLQAARAARGTQGYQTMIALLEAEIEHLKDRIGDVPDSELPKLKYCIAALKTIVWNVEHEPRERAERKTGAYTD